jgi:hypothetical protein
MPSLTISLFRSPMASVKVTDLPLQIPPYRKMAKKNYKKGILKRFEKKTKCLRSLGWKPLP